MIAKQGFCRALLAMGLLVLQGCASNSATMPSSLIAEGASLKNLDDIFQFTEGPAADLDGNVYFTDIPAQRIYKWNATTSAVDLVAENTGKANGLMFDADGNLVICEMENNQITRRAPSGEKTVIADNYQGKSFTPNDLWIDAKGGIYYSDFQRSQGPDSGNSAGSQVYYIPAGKSTPVQVTTDLTMPNGVIGTPDGKTLYVTDMGNMTNKKTWKFTINADGSLSDKVLFAPEQGHDGMTMDEFGNLYVTGDDSIFVYSPSGEELLVIKTPNRPANVTFGGKNRKTLFITSDTIYLLPMNVAGAKTPWDLAND